MPTFQYQSVTRAGQAVSGTIDALDRAEAIRALKQRGETATQLAPLNGRLGLGARNAVSFRTSAAAASADIGQAQRGRQTMRRGELASFIREIATALDAGLPLMSALRAVEKQASSERQKAVIEHLMSRIEAGRSLAQAALEWGNPFDDMIVGMLRAGEASGRLEVVMMQLADLLDRELETKRSVASALMYPAILIVVLAVGIAVIVTFIIPRVLESLEGQTIQLPLPTRIVKGFADFLGSYWWLVLALIGLAWAGWKSAMAQPHIRLERDRLLLGIPIVGSLVRDVAVGRFTRTLGTLMASGIPIIDAIIITRDTLGNKAMEGVIDEVADKIRSGQSIAEPMEKSGYFPPILIQIIDLGERSGRLDTMLTQAAESFDRRTAASLKMFTAALPPVIVVLMAVVIGFVILSVILPMLSLQSAIG